MVSVSEYKARVLKETDINEEFANFHCAQSIPYKCLLVTELYSLEKNLKIKFKGLYWSCVCVCVCRPIILNVEFLLNNIHIKLNLLKYV